MHQLDRTTLVLFIEGFIDRSHPAPAYRFCDSILAHEESVTHLGAGSPQSPVVTDTSEFVYVGTLFDERSLRCVNRPGAIRFCRLVLLARASIGSHSHGYT